MAAVQPAAWWDLVKQVATSWREDYVASMGAALAYYTMFLAGAAAADRGVGVRASVR